MSYVWNILNNILINQLLKSSYFIILLTILVVDCLLGSLKLLWTTDVLTVELTF